MKFLVYISRSPLNHQPQCIEADDSKDSLKYKPKTSCICDMYICFAKLRFSSSEFVISNIPIKCQVLMMIFQGVGSVGKQFDVKWRNWGDGEKGGSGEFKILRIWNDNWQRWCQINNCINERLYFKICVQDGNGKLDYTEFGQMLLALDVIP